MTDDRTMVQGSIEYLDVPVTADVELTMDVELSLDRGTTWTAAAWTGDAGTTRTARLLLDSTGLARTRHPVWVRFTDLPEVPIILAGFLKVI